MAANVVPEFSHIRDWVFDLDNCLYPVSTGLFALIDERMTAYVQRLLDCEFDEARRVQKDHFHTHGTTLAGLMRNHEIDPHEFLADVHDIAGAGKHRHIVFHPAADLAPGAPELILERHVGQRVD